MENSKKLRALERRLTGLLQQFLLENHLELAIALQEDHRFSHFLESKVRSARELICGLLPQNRPAYVIEALCLEEMTSDLRPSCFRYVSALLESVFLEDFKRMKKTGVLTYEIIGLIGACEPIFEVFGFGTEGEDAPGLRLAITGMAAEYLERYRG
jgi:hypothetical protein